jgi:hypothetical protein
MISSCAVSGDFASVPIMPAHVFLSVRNKSKRNHIQRLTVTPVPIIIGVINLAWILITDKIPVEIYFFLNVVVLGIRNHMYYRKQAELVYIKCRIFLISGRGQEPSTRKVSCGPVFHSPHATQDYILPIHCQFVFCGGGDLVSRKGMQNRKVGSRAPFAGHRIELHSQLFWTTTSPGRLLDCDWSAQKTLYSGNTQQACFEKW